MSRLPMRRGRSSISGSACLGSPASMGASSSWANGCDATATVGHTATSCGAGPRNGVGENDVTFFAALWQAGSATSSGTVAANGVLATLYIDTTGFLQGVWTLSLANTIGGPTDWAGSIFNGEEVPNPTMIDGSIIIFPEPGATFTAILATAVLVGVAVRRRAR